MSNRITEDYRNHQLVAASHDGKYLGIAWRGKEKVVKLEGNTLEDIIIRLKASVDSIFESKAASRLMPAKCEEYVMAFRNILISLSDGHLAMIKAHYLSPNHSITSTQLAKSAGYANFNAANLQYGSVGKQLYDELPIKLPVGEDGHPIYTFMLAEGNYVEKGSEWIWVMRPEVVCAVEILGLNK